MWDNIKAWFKHSVTILWARIVMLAGVLCAVAQVVFADPNVTAAMQSVLPMQYWPLYLILFGVITELTRRRTAGKV